MSSVDLDGKVIWSAFRRQWVVMLLGVLAGGLPLLLTLVWGTFYADGAYDTLRFAQHLSAGRPLTYDAQISGISVPMHSPLLVLVLAQLARLGLPILESSLVLSGIGWSLAAVLLVWLGVVWKRPFAGFLAAFLLAFHPVVFLEAGRESGWLTAVFILLVVLICHPSRGEFKFIIGRALLLVMLLELHMDLSTVVLAILLWIWLWRQRRRLPWVEMAAILLTVLLLGGFSQLGLPQPWPGASLALWLTAVRELVQGSELIWLYLPLLGVGLYGQRQNPLVLISLGWGAAAILSGSLMAFTATAVATVLISSLGVAWLGRWLIENGRVTIDADRFLWGMGGIVLLLMGAAHVDVFWSDYQFRPQAQHAIEASAARWISQNSPPDATVYASRRTAFLADRTLVPDSRMLVDPLNAGQVIAPLVGTPPDYFVTFRSIGWDFVTRTSWFEERYRLMQRFSSPYAVNAPFSVWAYKSSPFDLGETAPLQVAAGEGVDLVGYRYWPNRIEPGDGVYVTLFWQASQPVTANFKTIVRVISPVTGEAFAQRDGPTPRSVPAGWWEAGSLIEERFVMTTTEKIDYGAYQVNLSVRYAGEEDFQPLYQNNDTNPLDRILLGYTAVPWPDSVPETAVPVGATFGDQMQLVGGEVNGRVAPGEQITVDLFWQALRVPDHDYVVFVHLLNQNNEQIGGDDRQPVSGFFPTTAWQPDEIVKDSHPIMLSPDLPEGTYTLKVGVYLPETLERLPVWDVNGDEQPERSIPLPPMTTTAP